MSRPCIGLRFVPGATATSKQQYVWDGQPMRAPRAGEFFLSGAEPVAYFASNDLTTPYWIMVPVTPASRRLRVRTLGQSLSRSTAGNFAYRSADQWRAIAAEARELAEACDMIAKEQP